MKEQTNAGQELSQLRSEPTAVRWQAEIYRILRGERDDWLRRTGSPVGYVDNVLRDSDDPAQSHAAFLDALSRVTQAWKPDRQEVRGYLVRMLALLKAYTPKEGFAKVLMLAQGGRQIIERLAGASTSETDLDPLVLAMLTLKEYLPALPRPDAGSGDARNAYVQVLRQLTFDGRCASRAHKLLDAVEVQVRPPVLDPASLQREALNRWALRDFQMSTAGEMRRAHAAYFGFLSEEALRGESDTAASRFDAFASVVGAL